MASEVTFSGLGSGIDFDVVRDAILASKSRPITLLQGKVNNYSGRIGAFKDLNAAIAALATASDALTNRDLGFGRATNTSDALIATATADAKTTIGQYNLSISRLATSFTQNSRSYASEDTAVLAGGATTATFELRKGGSPTGVAITIDSTNDSLAGLRDAINQADAGITATIVDIDGTGTSNQLVLTSDETGATGRVEIFETTSTGTLADLSLTNLNPPDSDFSKLDASLSINNLNITRSSNTISDAVTGLNLSLKQTGDVNITVSQSTDIENKLRAFVNAYNAVQDLFGAQYAKDENNRPTGVLAGEATFKFIQRQIAGLVRTEAPNNGGSLTGLSALGITADKTGKLTLDTTVLNERLTANTDDVRSLLFGATDSDTGVFQSIQTIVDSIGDEVSGTIQTAIKGYESSIENLNKSINNRLDYISRLRESLTRQFAAADAAIGQLNGQGSALTSIINSLNTSRDDN